jgi:hypothetical protein
MERPRLVTSKDVQYERSEDEEANIMDQSESESEFTSESGEEDGDDEEYESEAKRSPKVFQISTSHHCKPLHIMI